VAGLKERAFFGAQIEADIELQDAATLLQTLAAVATHRIVLTKTRPTVGRYHVLANKTKDYKLYDVNMLITEPNQTRRRCGLDRARACGSSGHFISDMHDTRHLESLGGTSHLAVARGRTADCGPSVLRHRLAAP